MKEQEIIITHYIEAYNHFDVNKMVKDFSKEIVFENVENGFISMALEGIDEFVKQAEAATSYFSVRKQSILSFKHEGNKSEIEIAFFGVLATDLPNGMKKGQEIHLKGKSEFYFEHGKIVKLMDIS
ncbi:MAG: hypothetical protein OHK0053_24560 [Microscillaceae bacterium]